ncbi:MAG: hypothetical protein UMR38_03255 [Candidatus Izemoplasma sp.]|nr:hypothetical protein [Candidatus Izemoplasma sp.]
MRIIKDTFDNVVNNSIVTKVNDTMAESKAYSRRLYKITSMILFVTLVILFSVFYIFDFILIMYFIMIGLFLLILGIVYLVRHFQERKQILYGVVYPHAIKTYNTSYETAFTYEEKPEKDPKINQEMGLFTRYASVSHKYRIDGQIEDVPVSMMHMRLVTSNGKSASVHFDGEYTVVEIKGLETSQIRNAGRPALKKVSFKRIKTAEDKVYILKTSDNEHPPAILRKTYDKLKSTFKAKYYYVASNEQALHFAFWPKERITLPKDLSLNLLNQTIKRIQVMHYQKVMLAKEIIDNNKTL